MEFLAQGFVTGLGLSILVGPILITILQSSLEYGKWAGFAVGAGIWTSDVMYITLTYFGLSKIKQFASLSNFELFIGIIGGLILIGFGCGIFFAKVHDPQLRVSETELAYSPIKQFLKGLAINTLNPFTVLFWIGLGSTVVIEASSNTKEAFLFYGGILSALIVTDTVKIMLSDWLRKFLSVKRIRLFRRIAGGFLMAFGLALIIRVII
ncbi:MAG: LysE family transporter [Bacteroidota bacterium]